MGKFENFPLKSPRYIALNTTHGNSSKQKSERLTNKFETIKIKTPSNHRKRDTEILGTICIYACQIEKCKI